MKPLNLLLTIGTLALVGVLGAKGMLPGTGFGQPLPDCNLHECFDSNSVTAQK